MSIKKKIEQEILNLEDVPEDFISIIEDQNKKVFDAIFKLLLTLDQVDGNIAPTAANLQRIELIANALKDELFEGEYLEALSKFVSHFQEQGDIILEIYSGQGFDVKDNPLYKQVISNAQKNTLSLFDESAIENVLVSPVKDILTQSITTATKFSDAVENIKNFIEGNSEIDGRLSKYAKTYARDAFSIFDRSFTQIVNQDVEVGFWEFAGGIVKDSRDFCRERVGKIFTDEEVRSWASEDWQGKNPNTTEDTIFNYLGGYNCMHTLLPVSKDRFDELQNNQ